MTSSNSFNDLSIEDFIFYCPFCGESNTKTFEICEDMIYGRNPNKKRFKFFCSNCHEQFYIKSEGPYQLTFNMINKKINKEDKDV